jgi:hypothetical protein
LGNVLRISPPMNIGKSDVDNFVQALDECFVRVTAPAGVGRCGKRSLRG